MIKLPKSVKKYLNLNEPVNVICAILLLLLFVYLCISSYEAYKQRKAIPERLKQLEQEVKEIARRAKEKVNEPLPYEHNELPHPSKEMAQAPLIQEFDNFTCVSASYITWY